MKSGKSDPLSFPATYVHEVFSVQRPVRIAYKRGWSPLDSRIEECRDEQAWMVVLEYGTNGEGQEECQLAALYVRPSVSKNELRKAVRSLPSHRNKGKRPPIPDFYRQFLRAIWVTAETMAKKELRPKKLVEVAKNAMEIAKLPLSESKIWSECRTWRETTGRKVKKAYVTEKRERRSTKKTSN